MGKQRTIFDLFRQEDENFSSEPSNDAWAKLEHKLDGKKEIKPVRRINWWAIAASFVALIGAVSILQMGSTNGAMESSKAERSLIDDQSTFYVEDLVYTDANRNDDFQKEWEVSNKYRALFAEYSPSFQKNENLAANSISKIKRRVNQRPSTMIASNSKRNNAKANVAVDEQNEIASTESAPTMSNRTAEMAYVDNSTADYDNNQEDAAMIISTMDNAPASIKSKKMESKSNTNFLGNFQWLVGTWEQKRDEMKSVEKWVADSSNTIWGTGYLLQEDDTMFTENMCIKQIGDKIYFYQNIDTVNEQTKFVLTSQTYNNWNFSNTGGGPKNLILSNAGSNYNIEIQEIAPAQTHFLRQRNVLESNNAYRRMNKIE